MSKKYPVVAMCGSTRFAVDFEKYASELTLCKSIVLRPEVFGTYTGESYDEKTKKMLDDMHFEKINMCDYMFIVNSNGYIGLSTWDEIMYGVMLRKPMLFSYPLYGDCYESLLAVANANWGECKRIMQSTTNRVVNPIVEGCTGVMPDDRLAAAYSWLWLELMDGIDTRYPVV